jgi:hypothetical protein
MRDDLSGPMATEANVLPPQVSDADRKEAMLVDQFQKDPAAAQRMLDNRNALEGAAETVQREAEVEDLAPLPPAGEPVHIEPKEVQTVRLNLARIEGGQRIIDNWGSDFAANIGHAFAGLEKIRADNPELSRVLDSLPLEVQNRIAIAGGLEFADARWPILR